VSRRKHDVQLLHLREAMRQYAAQRAEAIAKAAIQKAVRK